MFDVRLGRSEPSLRGYLQGLEVRGNVLVVVMGLSDTYRTLPSVSFPMRRSWQTVFTWCV